MKYNEAQRNRERALVLAEDHMRKLGKFNPIRAPGQSLEDWYDARMAYGALESTAYALFLQQITKKDKPDLEEAPKPYTRQYGRPYHDD